MVTEDTPHWHPRTNRHTVYMHGLPLGVTCTCGRRTAIPLHRLGSLQGNMDAIHTLKLKCQACGSREWKATLFITMHEVEAFNGRPLSDAELIP